MDKKRKSNFTQLKTPLIKIIYQFLTIKNIAEIKKGVKNKRLLNAGNSVIRSKLGNNFCRFCLCRKRYDQIIRPCECKGNKQFVHEDCFKKYIEKNLYYEIHEEFSQDKIDYIKCKYCNNKITLIKKNKKYYLITFLRMIASLFESLDNLFFFQCSMYCLILLLRKAIKIFKQMVKNIKDFSLYQLILFCKNSILLALIILFFIKMIDLTKLMINQNLYKKIKIKKIFNKDEHQFLL